jgi:adenylate cyclase
VREAQILVEHTGDRWMEAELYRIEGALLLRQPTPDEAQAAACFNQSLAIARRQGARALELRTAVSLGRLWQRQGMQESMCQLLTPLCRGFTEGHDTADLRAARSLLKP